MNKPPDRTLNCHTSHKWGFALACTFALLLSSCTNQAELATASASQPLPQQSPSPETVATHEPGSANAFSGSWDVAAPSANPPSLDEPFQQRTTDEEQFQPRTGAPEPEFVVETQDEAEFVAKAQPEAVFEQVTSEPEEWAPIEDPDEIETEDFCAGVGLPNKVLFATGSSTVSERGKEIVRLVATKIPAGSDVTVHGYVDEQGTVEFNRRLGTARAQVIAGLFRDSLARRDITVAEQGHGEDDLLFPDCRGDCQRNRTVVIEVPNVCVG